MKKQISDDQNHRRIPWNLIVQVALAVIFFYFLGWLINSLSFAGTSGVEIRATEPISSLEIFDNFGFKNFDVKWNESTWAEVGAGSQMKQLDGVLILSREEGGFGGLVAHRRKWLLSQINYVESRLMLNSAIQAQNGAIGFEINIVDGEQWFVRCGIHGGQGEKTASVLCNTGDGFSTTPIKVSFDTWHIARFEVDSESATITFLVDGQNVGKYIPQDASLLKTAEYSLMLIGSSTNDGSLTGAFDYIQLKNK